MFSVDSSSTQMMPSSPTGSLDSLSQMTASKASMLFNSYFQPSFMSNMSMGIESMSSSTSSTHSGSSSPSASPLAPPPPPPPLQPVIPAASMSKTDLSKDAPFNLQLPFLATGSNQLYPGSLSNQMFLNSSLNYSSSSSSLSPSPSSSSSPSLPAGLKLPFSFLGHQNNTMESLIQSQLLKTASKNNKLIDSLSCKSSSSYNSNKKHRSSQVDQLNMTTVDSSAKKPLFQPFNLENKDNQVNQLSSNLNPLTLNQNMLYLYLQNYLNANGNNPLGAGLINSVNLGTFLNQHQNYTYQFMAEYYKQSCQSQLQNFNTLLNKHKNQRSLSQKNEPSSSQQSKSVRNLM